LYPTGLTFLSSTLDTTSFSGPSVLTVYWATLTPGTLTYYTTGDNLGPQAPAAVPVSVASTNIGVGTITGSPASIAVGTYYTQAISFVPATAGTTNLNLATPTGYFTPANQSVQLVTTVTAPTISITNQNGQVGVTSIVGNTWLSAAASAWVQAPLPTRPSPSPAAIPRTSCFGEPDHTGQYQHQFAVNRGEWFGASLLRRGGRTSAVPALSQLH